MNQNQKLLEGALGRLRSIEHRLRPAMKAMNDQRAGYPSGHEGTGTGGSIVEAVALGHDKAAIDERELAAAMRRLFGEATVVFDIVARYTAITTNPHHVAEEGCSVMARIGSWEPTYRTPTIDGRKVPLGRWAYRIWCDHGRVPTTAEAQAHADGRKVRICES